MNAVMQAIALAKKVQPSQMVAQLATKTVRIKEQVAIARQRKTGLLGIEREVNEAIGEKISELEGQMCQAEEEKERLEGINETAKKYLRLSLDPLSWRNKSGWPRLVVFSLDSPEFSVTSDGDMEPDLPEPMQDKYCDVVRKLEALERRARRDETVQVTCSFSGVIPSEVKEKITAAERDFGDDIFVIAEPKNFSIKRTARVDQDPLVVGYKHTALWLIADFDITPIEEAMIFTLPGATRAR